MIDLQKLKSTVDIHMRMQCEKCPYYKDKDGQIDIMCIDTFIRDIGKYFDQIEDDMK